jgi:hypothetical protein
MMVMVLLWPQLLLLACLLMETAMLLHHTDPVDDNAVVVLRCRFAVVNAHVSVPSRKAVESQHITIIF